MLAVDSRPSGLRVITERLDHLSSCAAGVWIGCGSSAEPAERSGLAHFMEHMVFRGTDRLSGPEISRRIEGVGGTINAFTNREYVLYWIRVPSEHLSRSLDTLCRMLIEPAFRPGHISKEREIVMAELGEREDSPADWVEDAHIENFLGKTALGRAILGEPATLGRIDVTDLRDCQRRFYAPENMILSVAGSFDPDQIEPAAALLESGGRGAPARTRTANLRFRSSVSLFDRGNHQTHFCLGFPGVSYAAPDRYAFAVMDAILGGGFSSRLFQQVREKRGLAYSIGSYGYTFRRGGVFNIGASVDPGDLQETLGVVVQELIRLKRRPVGKAPLKRAKEQIKGGFVIGLESTFGRMMWATKNLLFRNRTVEVEEMIQGVEAVTEEDVMRVADERFGAGPAAFTAVGPFGDERARSKTRDSMADALSLLQG